MNTTSLREYVYREAAKIFDPPLTRRDAAELLDIVFEGITRGLVDEEPEEDGEQKVLLRGFGKFLKVTRKGRTYNVHGKEVTVDDRSTVVFKPGTRLMRRLTEE
ncbi:MAG: HU family DNA-binding protein [Candidatus Omnitrophica bacterium]|nr:HU family DNA-binding protein [Candidatus Omnitrophota bacterium]